LETIYKWQNTDSETAIVGVMNLINLCERNYHFNADHMDTLLEVKNTCTLQDDELEKIYGFYDELMYKINTLDDGQKDFKEIFSNLDEYIKNNRKHGGVKIEDETEIQGKNSNTTEIIKENKNDINNIKIN